MLEGLPQQRILLYSKAVHRSALRFALWTGQSASSLGGVLTEIDHIVPHCMWKHRTVLPTNGNCGDT